MPVSRRELHADGQAFRRPPDRNHRSGIAQQVENFRVAPRVEIVDGFAIDGRCSPAVAGRSSGVCASNSRIRSLALCSCDFEFPTEQPSNSAIS